MTATRWASEHSPACWIEHPDCALKAAQSLAQARMAHDQARNRLYASALKLGPENGAYGEAVEIARQELTDSHQARRERR